MKSHLALPPALSVIAIFLSLGAPIGSSAVAADYTSPKTQDLLRQMAAVTSDDCSPPYDVVPTFDVDHTEELLFEGIESHVADELNKSPRAGPSEAESRARSALREIEQWSAEINNSWPSDDRFHYQVLSLRPAILVRMYYRGHARLVLFGTYYFNKYESPDAGTKWGPVDFVDPSSRASKIDLYPLHRGRSERVRFLAKVVYAGCAGSVGEAYYGYEWGHRDGQVAEQIIKIEGAEGLDDSASKGVGKLSTTGKIIQLPYCFFSAVDTWDNPTLCAADSFDVSHDDSRFTGRIYNFPDLVVVNKAIQHAQNRDYVALRGYCASDAVAEKLIGQIPPFLRADDLKRVKTGPTREKVIFEQSAVYFDLVKRRGKWLLESFSIGDDR